MPDPRQRRHEWRGELGAKPSFLWRTRNSSNDQTTLTALKRTIVAVSVTVTFLFAVGFAAAAETYPASPVRVIVPFPGGSSSDVIARIVFERVGKSLGQAFIIDNRPGAGGNIGTAAAAKTDPDGYTLLFSSNAPLAANKVLFRDLGFDPESDFEPISLVVQIPMLLAVSAKLPVRTLGEFMEYVKKQPTGVNYSSLGVGTGAHLAAAVLADQAKLNLVHVIYRTSAQMVSDLISGEVPVNFTAFSSVEGPVSAGQVRFLGVTSEKRLASLSSVPTFAESGVSGFEWARFWFALLAPRKTPKPIVEKLEREISKAIADPAVAARFAAIGAAPSPSTPDELRKFISSEIEMYRGIQKRLNIAIVQ